KAIVVNDFAHITRKQIDKFTELAKKNGAKGLVVLKAKDNDLTGSARKFLSDDEVKAMYDRLQLKDEDAIFIVSDGWFRCCTVLGALRNEIGSQLGLKNKSEFSFLWVTEFPMFEWSEELGRWQASHHPFTQPMTKDIPLLDTDPSKVKANAYDIILNGYELGGGSLRIYDNKLQEKIFEVLGFTEKQIQDKFGFFIDAFQYGTPPHGGLAFGLDRIAMILSESDSIRDVIAFPKNANAKCPMSKAPTPVDPAQLEELHIEIKK
ncbi:MAG: Asp-tRNA(Asn)/Glu-tRNA(Gln) amidotransferase GatCAB subunit C, partial [Faecalicoccus sp.]|nr:Asp-tRNA(Asn)/Glu-tRNA(Gln) amidotransferase GatCAB subunit C [Faecalicoccus sp.]